MPEKFSFLMLPKADARLQVMLENFVLKEIQTFDADVVQITDILLECSSM